MTKPKVAPRHAVLYGMVDPRTKKLRYVGHTIQDLDVRLDGHLRDSRSPKLRAWLTDLRMCGLRPKMVVLKRVKYEDRFSEEKACIRRMHKEGCDLLNSIANPGFWKNSPSVRSVKEQIKKTTVSSFSAQKNGGYVHIRVSSAEDYDKVKHLESDYIVVKLFLPNRK